MKEYQNFISKFNRILGDIEKDTYHILEARASKKKSKTDRNICITEHWIERRHGKHKDRNWCMSCSTIFVNEEDLKKILEKVSKVSTREP